MKICDRNGATCECPACGAAYDFRLAEKDSDGKTRCPQCGIAATPHPLGLTAAERAASARRSAPSPLRVSRHTAR